MKIFEKIKFFSALLAFTALTPVPTFAQQITPDTGGGSSSGGAPVAGSCISVSGSTVSALFGVRINNAASDAILAADNCKLVVDISAVTVTRTIVQAGTTGFETGRAFALWNQGTANVNITTTTSTINGIAGATGITLRPGEGCILTPDVLGNYSVGSCYATKFVNLAGDTMTGALVLPNGTAAAPSLAIGDVSTPTKGFYRGGSSQINMAIAGVAVGAFSTSWLWGTTTFLNAAGGTPTFANVSNNSTEGRAAYAMMQFRASATLGPYYICAKAKSSTIGTMTVGASGDEACTVSFQHADGTGMIQGAYIKSKLSGAQATGKVPMDIVVGTAPAATGTVTAMANFDSSQHTMLGAANTPTIANNDCGSTTQGTVGAGSVDHAGLVTAGTVGVTSCKITFGSTWNTAARACLIWPANATAAAANTVQAYISAISTTDFTITGLALASAAFYWHCL